VPSRCSSDKISTVPRGHLLFQLRRVFCQPQGYAMELRLKTARTTRDIDLALKPLPVASGGWDANAATVLELLREAGRLDLQDFFTFVVGEATQDLDAAPYGGARFPVEARLAGRTLVNFHLDVSTGDVLREPYESLSGRDWLGFAGIARSNFTAISPEEQFAEKLHAFTLPRVGPGKLSRERSGGLGSSGRTNQTRCRPVAKGNSRNLPTSKNPRNSDCPCFIARLMARTVCGDGDGMWHRGGYGEASRHDRAVSQ